MTSSKEKIICTASDRTLLHLLDYIQNSNQFEVSSKLTQEGISSSILVNRKHLPRSLKNLIEKKLIIEQKKHVLGKKQQMKTYFLTDEGRIEAIRLKNYYSEKLVSVCIDNEKKVIKLSDVNLKFSENHSIASIISQIILYSVFDPNKKCDEAAIIGKNILSSKKIYEQALKTAWNDGILTVDEINMLQQLRKTLNISDNVHMRIQERILLSKKKHDSSDAIKQVYDIILSEALKDNKITKDEQAILNRVKKHFNLKEKN